MKHSMYNNRRVIWESKTKQLILISISILFVALALWTREKSSNFMFWGATLFFGMCGIVLLIRLINPKNLFAVTNSPLGKEILAHQFQQQIEDLGFFTYDDNGFTIKQHLGDTYFNWKDIETIFAYKEDRLTTDEIWLDIFNNESRIIQLSESTPGWYQFLDRLSKNIPSVPSGWEGKIAVPAFETKLTLLFDKKGRQAGEAQKKCYID